MPTMKSIPVLLIPSVFACGVLSNQVATPPEPFAVRDSAGRVRLTTIEGEDGAFGLVLLGASGKRRCQFSVGKDGIAMIGVTDPSNQTTATLSVTESGDCRFVLNQADGIDCRILGSGKTGDMSLGFANADDPNLAGFDCKARGEALVYVRSEVGRDEEQVSRSGILRAFDGNLVLSLGDKRNNLAIVEAAEEGARMSMTGDGKTKFGIVRDGEASMQMSLHDNEGNPRVYFQAGERGSGMMVHRKDGKLGVKLGLKENDDVSMELVNPDEEVLLRFPKK